MKILVTGAKGFVGKNLVATLDCIASGKDKSYSIDRNIIVYECDVDTREEELSKYAADCDFVFHLAGVNRPDNASEFMEGNFGFTSQLLNLLEMSGSKAPILMSSSIQAELDNDYGKSKKAGEDYLIAYGKKNNIPVFVFRLPNVFGKWCRPNYNSAVATFCNNKANDLPITVNNPNTELTLVYIDDVVRAFIDCILGKAYVVNNYCKVETEHTASLGYIVELLDGFIASRQNNFVPTMTQNSFEKKLYSTYLSYLPSHKLVYPLKMNIDERGSFTEFLKTEDFGQVSVNISKPKIVKGNHWHHTKNEKFLVVSGQGVVRFRRIGSNEVTSIFTCGEELKVIDIPCGYTHNIENLGDEDMITIMWANEKFDPNNPDTYFEEV